LVFSSPTFLFFFLPAVLVLYVVCPWKNIVLVAASLFFYAWGEPVFILLMLSVIAGNYLFGLALGGAHTPGRRMWLVLAVAFNVGILLYFKYVEFFLTVINDALGYAGIGALPVPSPGLPLGISFFVFQSMTYVVDIYWGKVRAERSLANVALYVSMFPQLVAGPIVRFREVARRIHERSTTLRDISVGSQRFAVGLAKKVLIADPLSVPVDAIFRIPAGELSIATAWFGALCFALQIYYDFSGYSDMGIGLGRMFGFRFPENFRHPYESLSLREFWRRWHMTLSRWFRDYLYFPLGGNRTGARRTYINLAIVFFLTGLWHGAAWNYIVWGLFHGLFMTLERLGLEQALARLHVAFRHLYLLMVVQISWVFFRAPTLDYSVAYLRAMFAGTGTPAGIYALENFTSNYVLLTFAAGLLFSVRLLPRLTERAAFRACRRAMQAGASGGVVPVLAGVRIAGLGAILVLCLINVAAESHKAFIYFRF
jgi:alginate O-acetyltransferase complex protein AlgI